jgi:hypothetical protein
MQRMTARRKTVVAFAGLLAVATQVRAWEPSPPRPPMPIPNVVALKPAATPIPVPTPRPTPVMMPILPPVPLVPRRNMTTPLRAG